MISTYVHSGKTRPMFNVGKRTVFGGLEAKKIADDSIADNSRRVCDWRISVKLVNSTAEFNRLLSEVYFCRKYGPRSDYIIRPFISAAEPNWEKENQKARTKERKRERDVSVFCESAVY